MTWTEISKPAPRQTALKTLTIKLDFFKHYNDIIVMIAKVIITAETVIFIVLSIINIFLNAKFIHSYIHTFDF